MSTTYGSAASALHSRFGEQSIAADHERKDHNEFMLGLVTDNDHKKDGVALGWVKVAYHYNGTDSTHWVPVAAHGGGDKRGWFFIPEIGDEVVIGFIHGSAQDPVVLGSVWNGKDKPAAKNPGGNHIKKIMSRGKQPGKGASSADVGSSITFDDEKNTITLEDGGKYARITFDAPNKKITIETLKPDADITFQAPQGDVKIVAKAVKIEAKQKFQAKSEKDLKMSTNAEAKLTASGKVTWAGANHKDNCGSAQAVTAATSEPKDIADPYST